MYVIYVLSECCVGIVLITVEIFGVVPRVEERQTIYSYLQRCFLNIWAFNPNQKIKLLTFIPLITLPVTLT